MNRPGRVEHAARWARADVDASSLWAASGAEWLTGRGVGVPVDLVGEVAGLVAHVDAAIDDPDARLAAVSVADGLGLLAERAASVGLGPSGVVSCGGATRLLAASDGHLAVTLSRDDDIDLVPAWLGIDGVAPGEHWATVEAAVNERSVADLVEQAVLLGLPCAAVAETSAPPTSGSGVLVERLVDRTPTTLDGLVVVNLASLWAGPLAGDALARTGARVITVESTERPDGSRATLGFFESLHGRTESVALPFRSDEGRRRLAALVARADVVVEGSRPRALAQLGIDAHECVRDGVRLWVSITGHGREGDAAHRVGFGDDAAVAGGLVGHVERGAPRFLADAVADPLAGLTAAATVIDLVDEGVGAVVDVALARVAASCAPPSPGDGRRVTEPSARSARPRPRTDRGGPLPLGRDTTRILAEFDIP